MEPDLSERITAYRKELTSARRRAIGSWLAAGGAIGTTLYVARTRFAELWHGARLPFFGAFLLLTILLFWLAARFDKEARTLSEKLRDLEAKREKGTGYLSSGGREKSREK